MVHQHSQLAYMYMFSTDFNFDTLIWGADCKVEHAKINSNKQFIYVTFDQIYSNSCELCSESKC